MLDRRSARPLVQPFTQNLNIVDRLSETQYKSPQGDPFEKVRGGGTVGVGLTDTGELVFCSVQFLSN